MPNNNITSQQIDIPIGAMLRVADFLEASQLKAIVCGRWGAVDEITLDVEFAQTNHQEFKQLENLVEEWYDDNEELKESKTKTKIKSNKP
jgi:hypothetical protein